MRLSEDNLFKTCANPQAHSQKLNRANRYENEMVLTYRDLNCSGASPINAGCASTSSQERFSLGGQQTLEDKTPFVVHVVS